MYIFTSSYACMVIGTRYLYITFYMWVIISLQQDMCWLCLPGGEVTALRDWQSECRCALFESEVAALKKQVEDLQLNKGAKKLGFHTSHLT